MARPGPGKGWRQTSRSGRPSSAPTARTSSLKSMRSGSTSSKRRASGRPATLLWDLIVEHACQLVADGAVHEQRRHGGVHSARQPADHSSLAHLLADAPDLLVDHRGGRPGALTAADVGEEALEDLLAVGRVHDLGVK